MCQSKLIRSHRPSRTGIRVGQLSDVVQLVIVVATRWLPRAHQSAHRSALQPSKYGRFRVARGGIEPPTYRFSGGRSYQLSYLAVRRSRCWHRRASQRVSLPDLQ
jgi:hypothetical protein